MLLTVNNNGHKQHKQDDSLHGDSYGKSKWWKPSRTPWNKTYCSEMLPAHFGNVSTKIDERCVHKPRYITKSDTTI